MGNLSKESKINIFLLVVLMRPVYFGTLLLSDHYLLTAQSVVVYQRCPDSFLQCN